MSIPNVVTAVDAVIQKYQSEYGDIDLWRRQVSDYFSLHPRVKDNVHTVKSRLKDPAHLREKLSRKSDAANPITADNLFQRVTDLAGVRVLLLHQGQFTAIKDAVDYRIARKEWYLVENPKAYTWDPETRLFFESLGYVTDMKESFYTSVHYVVKQHNDSPLVCEIQVRTLFEEIWGEVDHLVNYPAKTESASCRDQIRVLAKLIGAGSRLVDSIFASHSISSKSSN